MIHAAFDLAIRVLTDPRTEIDNLGDAARMALSRRVWPYVWEEVAELVGDDVTRIAGERNRALDANAEVRRRLRETEAERDEYRRAWNAAVEGQDIQRDLRVEAETDRDAMRSRAFRAENERDAMREAVRKHVVGQRGPNRIVSWKADENLLRAAGIDPDASDAEAWAEPGADELHDAPPVDPARVVFAGEPRWRLIPAAVFHGDQVCRVCRKLLNDGARSSVVEPLGGGPAIHEECLREHVISDAPVPVALTCTGSPFACARGEEIVALRASLAAWDSEARAIKVERDEAVDQARALARAIRYPERKADHAVAGVAAIVCRLLDGDP